MQDSLGHVSHAQDLPSIKVEPASAGSPSEPPLDLHAALPLEPTAAVQQQIPTGVSAAAKRISQDATAIGSGDDLRPDLLNARRPTLGRWRQFIDQNDKLMASRIECGDIRSAFSSKVVTAVEQNTDMQNRIATLNIALADVGGNEELQFALATYSKTLRELEVAAQELTGADKQLVQTEWAISQTVPQVLGEHADSTLELLQQNELDFKDEDTMAAETISEVDDEPLIGPAPDTDNHITGLQRDINRLEDRILELEDSHSIRAAISSATLSEEQDSKIAGDYQAEHGRLTVELQALRSNMERLRGEVSSNLGFVSPATAASDGQRLRLPSRVEEMLLADDGARRPVLPVRLHNFSQDAEPKEDHVREWLRHTMHRPRSDAPRSTSRIPVPVRQIPNQEVKSIILDALYNEKPALSAPSSMIVEDTNQTRSIALLSDDQRSVLTRSDPLIRPLTQLRCDLNDEQQELAEIAGDRIRSPLIAKRRSA